MVKRHHCLHMPTRYQSKVASIYNSPANDVKSSGTWTSRLSHQLHKARPKASRPSVIQKYGEKKTQTCTNNQHTEQEGWGRSLRSKRNKVAPPLTASTLAASLVLFW